MSQQITRRNQITAVCRQIPTCRFFEVRQRARRVCRELDVVEAAGLDGLQGVILRQLRRPVVVEPLVDLLAPPPLRERLLGSLGPPAQFGVHAGDQLHHECRRRCLGCGAGLLAHAQRAHVQAAVDELGLHGGERQPVALHRLDDPGFERSLVGVAQERSERA